MTRTGTAIALVLAAGSTAMSGQTASFAHSSFDLAEWTREAHTKPLNGTEGGAVLIVNGINGQTGDCLELRWFTPVQTVLAGIAFLDEANWDPATDGTITELSVGAVALRMDPNLSTIQRAHFYIEQDGRYYRRTGPSSTDPVVPFSEQGLIASDFAEVFFGSATPDDPNSNPDFSANGEPMRFGMGQLYAFDNEVTGINVKTGLDNFFLEIAYEPGSEPICPEDFNNDGQINLADLNILLGNFGSSVPNWTDGDATGDGSVDLADLNQVLGVFGTACF